MAKTNRRILMICLLFAGTAVLVALAHLRPRYDHLIQESPEMTAKRLDRENNAHYVLMEAANLLPEMPPELLVEGEDGFPYRYRPETGSLGHWLRINRPDNDMMLIEYLEHCRPARELAREALQKPYCLWPQRPESYTHNELRRKELETWRLQLVFVAEVVRNPCSDDPEIDACEHLFNAWKLSNLIAPESRVQFGAVLSAGVDVAKRASPAHRARLAEWLDQCRREWTPQQGLIDAAIRRAYGGGGVSFSLSERMRMAIPLERERRMVRRFESELREALAMTYVQYEQFLLDTPRFRDYEPIMFAPLPDIFLARNTSATAMMDGLAIVLALERFKYDNGKYPDSIEALAPEYLAELPGNPVDGHPYTYQRVEDDYVLKYGEESPRMIYPTDWRVTH